MSISKSNPSNANQIVRSILIGIDGSEHSKKALHYYLNLLHRSGDNVTLYSVSEPPSLPSFSLTSPSSVPTEEWLKIMQNRAKEMNQLENDVLADCLNKRVNARFLTIESSNVGDSLVKQAEKQVADLIVLGSRGLGAVKRTILGSVSDYVLHHSDSPVCVVPNSRCFGESE